MKKQKLMLFSGFLGSGKTTTMVATAKYLESQGIKVALITNDLGENLVDTNYGKLNGVSTYEISNGCLCHDIPGFLDTLKKIMDEVEPDYIFAEPVGSCLGLVHSVYQEFDTHYKDKFDMCPFTAVIDPRRYRTVYLDPDKNTFNEETTYMYKKQLEDADILLLNKCDLICEAEKEAILASIKETFPGIPVISICAGQGEHMDLWTQEFLHDQKPSLRDLDIDWDYLVNGDEHMGWYNNVILFHAKEAIDFNLIVQEIMERIQTCFKEAKSEIAHLKIMCRVGNEFAKAALTSTDQAVYFSEKLSVLDDFAQFNINIRAQETPENTAAFIKDSVMSCLKAHDMRASEYKEQSFSSFDEAPKVKSVCVSGACDCC